MKTVAKLCLVISIVSSTLFLVPQGEAVVNCCASCGFQTQGCIKRCGLNLGCRANCEAQYDSCAAACALQGQYC